MILAERSHDGATEPPTTTQVNAVMSDFQAGIAFLQACFSVKGSFVNNLPTMLLGLCHPLPERRQHIARRCLSVYDSKNSFVHRKSRAFLQRGSPLRSDIELLARSDVTTPALELQVAPLLMVPFGAHQI